jgi:type III restriction enzyme
MKRVIEQISQILSLRAPQREALETLDRLLQHLPLSKEAELAESLKSVQSVNPTFEEFERDFPSLCFALATGVGKTRLMGAFIAYLHRVKGIHHFLVLAPNLTIYNKLVQDFTPNTPKYVLKGIPQFSAQPPEIITGENFERGLGIRNEYALQGDLFEQGQVHINIFNIAKINAESKGEQGLRIKRLSEYLGVSYFEYLSELDDLVLLMDESHRYRASAGVRAINELKPILGLELTATPYTEGRSGKDPIYFKNRAYHYPLSKAIEDGFVKVPAVGGRTDFNAEEYSEAALELIKLEDGIRIHEETKLQLHLYARETAQEVVKPFVLVIAEDTSHADHLLRIIESDSFFRGEYRNKVLVVHSKLRGEEEDLTVSQLLSVESSASSNL